MLCICNIAHVITHSLLHLYCNFIVYIFLVFYTYSTCMSCTQFVTRHTDGSSHRRSHSRRAAAGCLCVLCATHGHESRRQPCWCECANTAPCVQYGATIVGLCAGVCARARIGATGVCRQGRRRRECAAPVASLRASGRLAPLRRMCCPAARGRASRPRCCAGSVAEL